MASNDIPDVVIIDLQLEHSAGVETTRAVRRLWPSAKAIAISFSADQEYRTEAIKAGAHGFVASDSAQTDLIAAIHAAFRGTIFASGQNAENQCPIP